MSISSARIILSWDINENWNTSFTALTQDTKAGSSNDFDPFVGDLQTVRFHEDPSRINGRCTRLPSTATSVSRNWSGRLTTTSANMTKSSISLPMHTTGRQFIVTTATTTRRTWVPYYWANPETGYVVWWPVYCQGEKVDSDFYSAFYEPAQQDKFTTEVRLSHQGDKIDWIAGFYYEDSNDSWQSAFALPTNGGKDYAGAR